MPAPVDTGEPRESDEAAAGSSTHWSQEIGKGIVTSSRLEEGLLMGKLMETEMTMRPKFESGKELRRVHEKATPCMPS